MKEMLIDNNFVSVIIKGHFTVCVQENICVGLVDE
jgi:hypothetical protein